LSVHFQGQFWQLFCLHALVYVAARIRGWGGSVVPNIHSRLKLAALTQNVSARVGRALARGDRELHWACQFGKAGKRYAGPASCASVRWDGFSLTVLAWLACKHPTANPPAYRSLLFRRDQGGAHALGAVFGKRGKPSRKRTLCCCEKASQSPVLAGHQAATSR